LPGIYVHIPFCRQACHYCDFHFSVSHGFRNRLIPALASELSSRKSELGNSEIQTLYFGGGTPTLLSDSEWNILLNAINSNYSLADSLEFTVEANPDDLSSQNLRLLNSLGVNRLSVGVQSFRDEDLSYMNRAHNARQAITCIPLAQDMGFSNISIDLIYGTPGLSDHLWEKNLSTAFSMNIQHVSSYALTVENNTPLQHLIRKGLAAGPDDETQSAQFMILQTASVNAGFEPYEISNYALPGYRSAHNSSYWEGKAYLGIGPSAHSFDGKNTRSWNIANNARYVQGIESGSRLSESEILSPSEQISEYILIRLRTIEGLNLTTFDNIFGSPATEQLNQKQKFMPTEWFIPGNKEIRLSNTGKLFADHIASELFPDSI
jgi:oxygen-independent coproporphyrinogen-3 oxidase